MPGRTNASGESARIPLHRSHLTGREIEYVARAIRDRGTGSDGQFTRACARLLEDRLGIGCVLMTPSCTAALEMAAMLCDLQPGDEVILPSFTFVSTANAVVRLGARPVFVDIRPDTLNLDETAIEAAVTPRTRAIMPVHYAGVACAMEEILRIASLHDLIVIEDAAQAVNATFRGRALGSLGQLGAFSFHETKNFSCGEGGALCVNAPDLRRRAEVIRDKGTNRGQFLRGEVDKYTWVDVGSSYVPAEITCAYLLAQLERMDVIIARRRAADRFYRHLLRPLARQGLLRLPEVPEGCGTNYHNFFILVRDEATRNGLMGHLRRNGIAAAFHFVPLHTSPMGRTFGYRDGDLPRTEDLSRRLLRLPFDSEISAEEQARVARRVTTYLKRKTARAVSGISVRDTVVIGDALRC